jgi:TIR domain/SEFIR domain/Effector-associated domain 7
MPRAERIWRYTLAGVVGNNVTRKTPKCTSDRANQTVMPTSPKVFISYSHNSEFPDYRNRILALADRLRQDGIDANIDQYEQSPPEGWQRWMMDQVESADFVLVACTEEYNRRFRGNDAYGKGKGVTWEGGVIIQEMYETQGLNSKFIPIILNKEDSKFIPTPLHSATNYGLHNDGGYELLYRRLTNQPQTLKPELGKLQTLPAIDRKQNFQESFSSNPKSIYMPSQPPVSKISQLIEETLSDDELINLCYDEFPSVFQEFIAGQTKSHRIRALVEHVDLWLEIPKLLDAIRRINPNAYTKLFSEIASQNQEYSQKKDINRSTDREHRFCWSLTLDIDDVSPQILESILTAVRQSSKDNSISLVKVRKGSIVLVLEGTEEGFKIIQALFDAGQIKEIMGLPIKAIAQEMSSHQSMSEDYKYDVFISYSSKDRPWVKSTLLIQLENQGLKVCIDYRDFVVGKPSIVNIEQSVLNSRKTLLVMTPNYLDSGWTEFENILLQTLDPSNQQLRLLPLLQQKCKLPLRLSALTYLDFAEPEDIIIEWERLISAIKYSAPESITAHP